MHFLILLVPEDVIRAALECGDAGPAHLEHLVVPHHVEEALDLLRDHGLSVIGITDRILGSSVMESSEEKAGDSLAQSLQEAAGAAGSDAADAAAKAGESAVSAAQQAAEKTTQSFFDALREKITSFFETLFVFPQ